MSDLLSLKKERFFWRRQKYFVFGLDEVGRGAVAGPVVAGAIWVSPEILKEKKFLKLFKNLKDSKKLTPLQREYFFNLVKNRQDIFWATAQVSEKMIDKINILRATKLAMKKALKNLILKLKKSQKIDENIYSSSVLILDGKDKIDLPFFQYPMIKADENVFSCALSSIVAKVKRDGIMKRYSLYYKNYDFDKHKGYLTKKHLWAIKKFGFSPIHRKTFYPFNQK